MSETANSPLFSHCKTKVSDEVRQRRMKAQSAAYEKEEGEGINC